MNFYKIKTKPDIQAPSICWKSKQKKIGKYVIKAQEWAWLGPNPGTFYWLKLDVACSVHWKESILKKILKKKQGNKFLSSSKWK